MGWWERSILRWRRKCRLGGVWPGGHLPTLSEMASSPRPPPPSQQLSQQRGLSSDCWIHGLNSLRGLQLKARMHPLSDYLVISSCLLSISFLGLELDSWNCSILTSRRLWKLSLIKSSENCVVPLNSKEGNKIHTAQQFPWEGPIFLWWMDEFNFPLHLQRFWSTQCQVRFLWLRLWETTGDWLPFSLVQWWKPSIGHEVLYKIWREKGNVAEEGQFKTPSQGIRQYSCTGVLWGLKRKCLLSAFKGSYAQ